MQVRVSPLAGAEELAQGWANMVVSMIGPDVSPIPTFDAHPEPVHMILIMEDTEVITDQWSPKYEDIAMLFSIADGKENVLVHCEGGISRSTAVGLGLLVSDGMSVEDAVKEIHRQSPNMAPNKLILHHIDRYLHLGGHLTKQVQEVMNTLPKDLTLWCAECQVHFVDGEHQCPHWTEE
jgi:predicted protein tyrosine phosphatase